ncbi:MAG TPA: glucokinase [Blastocatellia bacterium]|nr:glucokinase [Blastocatellia bacterium]
MILAGDIGGTKTNLGLFQERDGELRPLYLDSYPSREHIGLEVIVTKFMSKVAAKGGEFAEPVRAASFGIAGPIIDGKCDTTNLPWVVSAHQLARTLNLPDSSVTLLNDLEATAHGVFELKDEEFVSLNQGHNTKGNAGLVAAGTGLGIACFFWDGTQLIPSASEGGHVDFAPRNQMEMNLLRYLIPKYGHVSVERIVSGPGLHTIYEFLRESGYHEESPGIRERMLQDDPSSVVSKAALSGECPMCVQALDMFSGIYGATAGNLALTLKSLGGIYIGGGIAPKIIEKLKDGTFMGAFLDKGRFASLLATIPVRVIMNDKTALLGAARVAADTAT